MVFNRTLIGPPTVLRIDAINQCHAAATRFAHLCGHALSSSFMKWSCIMEASVNVKRSPVRFHVAQSYIELLKLKVARALNVQCRNRRPQQVPTPHLSERRESFVIQSIWPEARLAVVDAIDEQLV